LDERKILVIKRCAREDLAEQEGLARKKGRHHELGWKKKILTAGTGYRKGKKHLAGNITLVKQEKEQ
jgi:hypothetical protein